MQTKHRVKKNVLTSARRDGRQKNYQDCLWCGRRNKVAWGGGGGGWKSEAVRGRHREEEERQSRCVAP